MNVEEDIDLCCKFCHLKSVNKKALELHETFHEQIGEKWKIYTWSGTLKCAFSGCKFVSPTLKQLYDHHDKHHFSHSVYDRSQDHVFGDYITKETGHATGNFETNGSGTHGTTPPFYVCRLCSFRHLDMTETEVHVASKHVADLEVRELGCLYCQFKCRHSVTLRRHVMVS